MKTVYQLEIRTINIERRADDGSEDVEEDSAMRQLIEFETVEDREAAIHRIERSIFPEEK